MRSESNMLLNAATIFVKIDVNDYVPGGLAGNMQQQIYNFDFNPSIVANYLLIF